MSSPFTGIPPGGIPDHTDLVLGAVFLPLFVLVGVHFHLRAFHVYKRKFIWSIFCFGFCMARALALGLRIGTTKHQRDKDLLIAAQVFVAAGTLIVYIVNLQMSKRFLGQLRPLPTAAMKYFVNTICLLLIPLLAMTLTAVIQSILATNPTILNRDRKVRLVSAVFMTVFAFLPIPIVLFALFTRTSLTSKSDEELVKGPEREKNGNENGPWKSTDSPSEPNTGFGPRPSTTKEMYTSAAYILIPTALMTFEMGIRTTQSFHVPKRSPMGPPTLPWYSSKAAFWIFVFVFEWVTALILGLANLPRRFSNLPAPEH